jgi:hypothetical protein
MTPYNKYDPDRQAKPLVGVKNATTMPAPVVPHVRHNAKKEATKNLEMTL